MAYLNVMNIIYDDESMREAFGKELLNIAEQIDNVYAVSADTENSMGFTLMAQCFPERVINVGICEQNMALVAAGISVCGGKSFAATYAPFASMRMLEQVRSYIAYSNLDVKIIAGMGGLSGSSEGVAHHGIEDISIMRSIPNLVVVVAADACSTREIVKKITEYKGPVYLRLGRNAGPKIFTKYSFQIGKANVIKEEGEDAAIICNGTIMGRVFEVVNKLKSMDIHVKIIEMPCVKPLDTEVILRVAKETGKLITIEENNIIGGLGGAVAELVSENYPVFLLRIGINDEYTRSGQYDELLDKFGFSLLDMCERIILFIKGEKTN